VTVFPPDEPPSVLTARYRLLAKTHHPDAGGSVEAFETLTRDYQTALAHAREAVCPRCLGTRRATLVAGFHSLSMDCPVCDATGLRWPHEK